MPAATATSTSSITGHQLADLALGVAATVALQAAGGAVLEHLALRAGGGLAARALRPVGRKLILGLAVPLVATAGRTAAEHAATRLRRRTPRPLAAGRAPAARPDRTGPRAKSNSPPRPLSTAVR